MFKPDLNEFKSLAQKGNLIPVYKEIIGDIETPVSAFIKLGSKKYSFLLESVEGDEKWARYCFLGIEPSVIFELWKDRVNIISEDKTIIEETNSNPLDVIKKKMSEYMPVEVADIPRFFGGAVGFLSYDMVRYFEELPDNTCNDLNIPDGIFIITNSLLIFDNIKKKIKVLINVFIKDGDNLDQLYKDTLERIEGLIKILRQPIIEDINSPINTHSNTVSTGKLEFKSNLLKEDFLKAVKSAKRYILEGDIFQVVLSQRLEAVIDTNPFDIYRALRIINPSPYMYYLNFGAIKIIGTSPEVLVRLENQYVELRPIAGTRHRGKTEKEDIVLEKELLNDPKECAEHIMLVDLGRNDIGRIAEFGSVKVNNLMVIERYSHVMHIVSSVKGILKKGLDCYDVLRAVFPAGTLSGAPKIRAMEIIDELEPTRRGTYGGAVGYFSFGGNMDMAITIRTLMVKDNIAYLGVGAGIVADSVPEKEYEETLNKGKAILKAIEMAREGY